MEPNRDDKDFNPFPGLRPFTPEESDLFFGREADSEELLRKLIQNRFVTVIGASGSGKSSLIHSGVLPKVRNLKKQGSSDWRIIPFRPGNDPFGNLADSLSEDIEARGQGKIEKVKILSELHNNPQGISGAVRNLMIKSDERILMVIDQFEELFRYGSQGKTNASLTSGTRFVDFMVKAVSESSLNIFTIIIMRSDYIGECAHYQGLTQLINNSNYLVPQLGKENYRKVIEGPVNYAGAKIDPGLVDTLLKEIGNRADQLPVLQHAMMRTYAHWLKTNDRERPVSKADYESAGTMRNAMSLHANEAYEELSSRGKEICRIMFKTITEKGSDNKGFRRPEGIDTIKTLAGCTEEELFEVIEKFRTPSRSFLTPRQDVPLTEESIIDISHESLIHLWDRLREWVDDEASSVQMYLRLSETSALYQQGKASLLRPPDIQMAVNWRDQNKPTLEWAERYNPAFERAMVYLRTSEKAFIEEEENKIKLQKRKIRRTRIIATVLGVAVIISLTFMLFAFVRKVAAEKQTAQAEQQKAEAEKQKLKADSIAIVATTDLSIADSNTTVAKQMIEESRNNADLANQEKNSAITDKEIAIKKEQIAEKEKENAMRLRMLSVSKAMAVRSLQTQDHKDLQALLAYQAYLFNKRNNGPDNDADIFAGLYNITRQYDNLNYKSFKGHDGDIRSIAFVPGKREFFTSGSDGKIFKWSLDNKDQTLQVIYSGTDIIDVLAVSPDDSWLACGSENSVIRMIPLKPNKAGYELKGHKDKVKSLIFSYDGKYLYSAALDGNVLKWDLAARTSTNLADGTMQITSIDISSDGNHLAGISSDGGVLVWNPENKTDKFSIETTGKNIKAIRFDPENNLLAIGDVNGTVELWDIRMRKKISEVKAHDSQINDIRFNTRLKQMATAGNDKKLKLFNIKDPSDLSELPVTFADNEGVVLVMEFSPDGQVIVSGEFDGSQSLKSRPTNADYMAKYVCENVTRNMTQQEWNNYVGKDIPIEKTCPASDFKIKVDVIK
jgi:WD40 repeat protein